MNIDAILTALLIPFAGTALGSAFVFFMKNDIPGWLQKALLGFASGVMVAASTSALSAAFSALPVSLCCYLFKRQTDR